MAVWQDSGSDNVYSAFLPANGFTWTMTPSQGYNVHQTDIAISPGGIGVVVWSVKAGAVYGPIYAVTFQTNTDLIAYSRIMQVSAGSQQASAPVVTIDTSGNALAVTEENQAA